MAFGNTPRFYKWVLDSTFLAESLGCRINSHSCGIFCDFFDIRKWPPEVTIECFVFFILDWYGNTIPIPLENGFCVTEIYG